MPIRHEAIPTNYPKGTNDVELPAPNHINSDQFDTRQDHITK